jgi:F0F1-type ATP synthase delta subunit
VATVKRSELAAVLAQLVVTTKDQKKLAKAIADYLVSQHQTRDLDAIMRGVMAAREQSGTIEANVTSAFPLSSGLQKEIKQVLQQEYPTATKVVVNEDIKPDVLSGLKVQTIDKQLDETARGKLQQLTRAVA